MNSFTTIQPNNDTLTRHYQDTTDRVSVGDTVRLYGDTFRNPYTVVAMFTREVRRGHKLHGADLNLQVIIRTWAGKDRQVSIGQITTDTNAWTVRDNAIVSNRVTLRAANRRAEALHAAAKERELQHRYDTLTSYKTIQVNSYAKKGIITEAAAAAEIAAMQANRAVGNHPMVGFY